MPTNLITFEQAYDRNPALASLLVDPEFAAEMVARQGAWRRVVSLAIEAGVSTPGLSTRWVSWAHGHDRWLTSGRDQRQRLGEIYVTLKYEA